eukprot:scaffold68297_cov120-Phaeocystis_antarctica.AAC.8
MQKTPPRPTQRLRSDRGGRQRLQQLALLLQLLHNIEPAQQLTVRVELRERRPVGERLQALSHLLVRENVEAVKLHVLRRQHLTDLSREAAARRVGAPLHEEHHRSATDQSGQPRVQRQRGGRQRLQQLALLLQLLHNVEPAQQLTIGVELRERRPVGERLQALSHLLVRENVEAVKLYILRRQHLTDLSGEAAARRVGASLHEEHHRRTTDQSGQPRVQRHRSGCGLRSCAGGGAGLLVVNAGSDCVLPHLAHQVGRSRSHQAVRQLASVQEEERRDRLDLEAVA